MQSNGWIPREQTRGTEAEGLCNCPDFLYKDDRDGNPPTLVLSILQLRKRDYNIYMTFIKSHYDQLEKWFNWYDNNLNVKKLDKGYIFKWWDREPQYMSLNSGLDDFPRNDDPMKTPYAHIDLQSWMYLFAESMETFAEDLNRQHNYDNIKQSIKDSLQYFKNEGINLYSDILQSLGKTNQKLSYSGFIGYPNLFPLAFGLLKKDELEKVLDVITDDKILWTPYGLRSLSRSSSKYMKNNQYWTGPIWININFLVLRGLKLYYFDDKRVQDVYRDLRQNLIDTVCGNLKNKHFLYENYNKNEDGKGSWSYPFSGWTTIISNIIEENY